MALCFFFLSFPYVGKKFLVYLVLDSSLELVKAEKGTTVPNFSWSLSFPRYGSSPMKTLQEHVC